MALSIPKIGLQLYTFQDAFAGDPFATLADVAAIGFDGVEFVGSSLRSIDLEQLKTELSCTGLKVAGIAFEIEELDDGLDSVLHICHSINCPVVVMPSIRNSDCQSRDSLIRVALKMNNIASRCKAEGVSFLYHTHGLELKVVDERSGLEWLSDCWDLQLVHLEVDMYWVEHAGMDALNFMKQYGDRCSSIHFKDMKDKTSKREAEIGAGVIDMEGIAREAMLHSVEWFIVEQEEFSGAPIESVKAGFQNLTRIRTGALQACV